MPHEKKLHTLVTMRLKERKEKRKKKKKEEEDRLRVSRPFKGVSSQMANLNRCFSETPSLQISLLLLRCLL